MSLWKKFDRFPPVLVRLVARHDDGTVMTDSDICVESRGGLGIADVRRLSLLTHWNDVLLGDAYTFCICCGVDFDSRARMRTLNRYLKDAKFSHLRRDKNFPHFREMLKIYLDSQTK